MPIIALPAHFDGQKICLDEPFDLKSDTKLIVTILPKQQLDSEHDNWLSLSGQKLKKAYGENEPEYSSNLINEPNPDYEAR